MLPGSWFGVRFITVKESVNCQCVFTKTLWILSSAVHKIIKNLENLRKSEYEGQVQKPIWNDWRDLQAAAVHHHGPETPPPSLSSSSFKIDSVGNCPVVGVNMWNSVWKSWTLRPCSGGDGPWDLWAGAPRLRECRTTCTGFHPDRVFIRDSQSMSNPWMFGLWANYNQKYLSADLVICQIIALGFYWHFSGNGLKLFSSTIVAKVTTPVL